jgi:tRNA U34 2-thiouridine synthase MnmA/TrmU
MMVKNINWLSGKSFSGKCKVKIRSMAPMVPVKIIEHVTHSMKQKKYKVIFDKEQCAVTPGQSAVFYSPAVASAKEGKGNELLGGGVII